MFLLLEKLNNSVKAYKKGDPDKPKLPSSHKNVKTHYQCT